MCLCMIIIRYENICLLVTFSQALPSVTTMMTKSEARQHESVHLPSVKKTTTTAAAAGAPTGRAKASSKRRAQPESDVESGWQSLNICFVGISMRVVQFGPVCLDVLYY